MSVEYRADRKKWGYRFYLADKCFKKYVWETKTAAKQAEQQAQVEARKAPALQPTALLTASGAYLIASAERRRSKWRIDGLHSTFKAHIIPYFGEATLITDITTKHRENFIADLKCKGLKNKSVKHIVANLSAMFVWAMESPEDGGPGLVSRNPVTKKVNRLIGSTRAVKKPINPKWFDIAADAIKNR